MTPVTDSIYGPRNHDKLFEAIHDRRAVSQSLSRALRQLLTIGVGGSSSLLNISHTYRATTTCVTANITIEVNNCI